MSKGKFGEPWKDWHEMFYQDYGNCPQEGVKGAMKRAFDCVNACNGIEDPEKTIPLLIELAKTYDDYINPWDGGELDGYTKCEELVSKVLKGVSDE